MLDTFVFRVNNLQEKYPMLVTMIRTDEGKETFATKSTKKAKKMEFRTFQAYYKDDMVLPMRYSDKRNIPSSNHDIVFTVDWQGDFLECNVSIPKMIYGTNIAELVIPPGHKDYSVNNTSLYSQIDYAFDVMKQTVVKCIMMIAQGNYVDLDWSDVEVCRFDICLNQHFTDRAESFRYLKHQRGLLKKHNRQEGSSNSAEFKTSITFKTSRYYAKIYHKGKEFADKQAQKIIKINEQRKRQHAQLLKTDPNNKKALRLLSSNIEYAATHIQELQAYADNILRYELEFKRSYLNYIWNYKVNKQWSRDWKGAVALFAYFQRNAEFAKNVFKHEVRYVNENGVESKEKPILIRKVNFYHRQYDADKRVYSIKPFTAREKKKLLALRKLGLYKALEFKKWMSFMQKELNKSRSFRFALPDTLPDTTREESKIKGRVYNNRLDDPTATVVRFTRSLLYECAMHFQQFFDNFQIRTKGSLYEFHDKLDAHDIAIERKAKLAISEVERMAILKQKLTPQMRRNLINYHTLHAKLNMKELVPHLYSRPTYFRVKKLYAEFIGQKENIADAHFSHLIERDITRAYEKLYADINFSCLTNLYNHESIGFGAIKRVS